MNPVRFAALFPDTVTPAAQTSGSAGFDLAAHGFGFPSEHARRKEPGFVHLKPGERIMVWSGVAIALPFGTVGLVCSRSGLVARYGLAVLGAPGIIDPDYRGEIGMPMVNLGSTSVKIYKGDRVAQLVVVACSARSMVVPYDSLEPTDRDKSGFGSTGLKS